MGRSAASVIGWVGTANSTGGLDIGARHDVDCVQVGAGGVAVCDRPSVPPDSAGFRSFPVL